MSPSEINETPLSHPPVSSPVETAVELWRRQQPEKKYRLLALLPVYNREDLLAKCLEALRPAVDGIIALDDGSTDETPHILRREQSVIEIHTKPPKNLSEWNDASNRRLLYEAAYAYEPEWLLCVDSDEILESTFRVYKEQLMNQSARIQGYAFPLVAIYENRITGPLIVDRMYRFRPNYRFDPRRLHCRIMPLDIRDEMIRTVNIRFFHHSASPDQKESRYNKYLIADPHREFQASYENLLRTNPARPILPVGGQLEMNPFFDDAAEVKEFFPDVEADPDMIQHLLIMQARLEQLLPLLHEFHNSSLDFFYVEHRLKNGDYMLSNIYPPFTKLKVSKRVAWLVEKYRLKKDFFYLAAGLAAFLNLEPGEGVEAFASVLEELKKLKVLN